MAAPLAVRKLAAPIATRCPRTSLIDAEWEWLARRAESADASDGIAPGDRDTAPGLGPFAHTLPLERLNEPSPTPRSRLGVRSKAFIANTLFSFALGVAALPLGESVARRVHQGSRPDRETSHLESAHPGSIPAAIAVEAIRGAPEPEPFQHESTVTGAAQPDIPAAPAPALSIDGATTRAVNRSVRRWSPSPLRRKPSDNPY